MGKIKKFSGYLLNEDELQTYLNMPLVHNFIEDVTRRVRHFHCEENEYSEEDKQKLKDKNVDLAICEKYFKSKPSNLNERKIEVGQKYRHFKGKIVEVLAISQDTENPGSFSVVYICRDKNNSGKTWHRPYDMFISEVDHEKYPEVTQKYRFELIEE